MVLYSRPSRQLAKVRASSSPGYWWWDIILYSTTTEENVDSDRTVTPLSTDDPLPSRHKRARREPKLELYLVRNFYGRSGNVLTSLR